MGVRHDIAIRIDDKTAPENTCVIGHRRGRAGVDSPGERFEVEAKRGNGRRAVEVDDDSNDRGLGERYQVSSR